MGVNNTRGHLASNGGLRGHSVGDCFPCIVIAVGVAGAHKWTFLTPSGIRCAYDFDTAAEASSAACTYLNTQ